MPSSLEEPHHSRFRPAMKSIFLLLSSLLLLAPAKAEVPSTGLLKSEFIYETAPFPSCHASTLAEPSGGGLIAAWFGGTAEKNPDVGIWVARLDHGKWTPPVEVATGLQTNGKRLPCWNPVLFQPKTGPLMLFYKVGPTPDTWWGMLRQTSPIMSSRPAPPNRLVQWLIAQCWIFHAAMPFR